MKKRIGAHQTWIETPENRCALARAASRTSWPRYLDHARAALPDGCRYLGRDVGGLPAVEAHPPAAHRAEASAHVRRCRCAVYTYAALA